MTVSIPGREDPNFRRDEALERVLKEQGLSFSSTLDWGMTVRYVIVESDSPEHAWHKIRAHKEQLERAYNLTIDLDAVHLAPKSTVFDPK